MSLYQVRYSMFILTATFGIHGLNEKNQADISELEWGRQPIRIVKAMISPVYSIVVCYGKKSSNWKFKHLTMFICLSMPDVCLQVEMGDCVLKLSTYMVPWDNGEAA